MAPIMGAEGGADVTMQRIAAVEPHAAAHVLGRAHDLETPGYSQQSYRKYWEQYYMRQWNRMYPNKPSNFIAP